MKKKKVQDVVINMYLMEWNGKEQELKARRILPTVSCSILRNVAEEK